MLEAIKKRWLLVLLLLVFTIAKIPHLSYAFYWDESWVYAPAIFMMYANGPSLSPNAIPVDFSRGHPLLYHALCAGWMDIFGKSNFSMHCFALAISLLLAIATYEILLKIFNKRVAAIGLIILLMNVNFYAMSSFVLTDIALALFALLSLYYYFRNRYILTAIFLSLLFYTKESGMVAAAVIGVDILWRFIRRTISLKEAILKSASLAAPLLLMFLFFAVQKHMFGWYLYPAHISLLTPGLESTLYNIQRGLPVIFYAEGILWPFLIGAALFTYACIKQRKPKRLLFLLYPVVLYICMFGFSYKDGIVYGFVVALLIGIVVLLLQPEHKEQGSVQHFIKLIVGFCSVFFYFSCINFFEGRYLLPVLFCVSAILLPPVIDYCIVKSNPRLFPYVVGIIVISMGWTLVKGDGALANYACMDVQQGVVDYLEQNNCYDNNICTKLYLQRIHLEDPKTGFLRSDKVFNHVSEYLDEKTDYVICDNIEGIDPKYSGFYDSLYKNKSFFLLQKFKKDGSVVDLYKRKQSGWVTYP